MPTRPADVLSREDAEAPLDAHGLLGIDAYSVLSAIAYQESTRIAAKIVGECAERRV